MAIMPVSSVLRAILNAPSLALETIMACKVFRMIVLGTAIYGKSFGAVPMATFPVATLTILSDYDSAVQTLDIVPMHVANV